MTESIGEMIIPGTYIEVRAEGLIGVGGISTGNIGVVGTANRGPVGEVVILGSYAEALDRFGPHDRWPDDPAARAALTLTRALEQMFARRRHRPSTRCASPPGRRVDDATSMILAGRAGATRPLHADRDDARDVGQRASRSTIDRRPTAARARLAHHATAAPARGVRRRRTRPSLRTAINEASRCRGRRRRRRADARCGRRSAAGGPKPIAAARRRRRDGHATTIGRRTGAARDPAGQHRRRRRLGADVAGGAAARPPRARRRTTATSASPSMGAAQRRSSPRSPGRGGASQRPRRAGRPRHRRQRRRAQRRRRRSSCRRPMRRRWSPAGSPRWRRTSA